MSNLKVCSIKDIYNETSLQDIIKMLDEYDDKVNELEEEKLGLEIKIQDLEELMEDKVREIEQLESQVEELEYKLGDMEG